MFGLLLGGWLVLMAHDVSRPPSPDGCMPVLLRHAIAGARARGMAPTTMTQALDLSGLPRMPS